MIYFPFANKKQFMKWYLSVSTFFSLVISIRIRFYIDGGYILIKENYIFLAAYVIFIFTAIFSCIYAFRFFNRPGMSREVKKMIL